MNKQTVLFVAAILAAFYVVNYFFSPAEVVTRNEVPMEQKTITAVAAPQEAPAVRRKEEFYVIENKYQQLVFSNIGGAIAEINLPLRSKNDEKSPIRPIDFDREMAKDSPENDTFPLNPFTTVFPKVTKLEKGTLGGYYPLLRRGIKGNNLKEDFSISPRYYAFNLVSENSSTSQLVYKLKRHEAKLIEFEAQEGNRRITKTYSFPDDADKAPYCFDLAVAIEGDAKGLSLTSGIPEVELISGNPAPFLKYRAQTGQKHKVSQVDLPKTGASYSAQLDWICNSNGFFGLIIDPLNQGSNGFAAAFVPGVNDPTRLSLIDSNHNLYPAEKYAGYEMRLALKETPQTTQIRVFAGPFAKDILKLVDKTYSNPEKGYQPNYASCQSFHGWFAFISEPFAKFLFFLMEIFHFLTRSWGISIILLTIALRLMLYPLTAWSIKSSVNMQKIAPEVKLIQDRNKKDPKKAQMEIMALYKQRGVNPLTGCLPLLIQMPFLIGMFDLLKSTFQLRGAVFIPGWINNLSAPDVLFSWGTPVFFFGTSFHLLPIILGAVMYFQQKLSSPLPKDSKMLTDQQKQQKMMGNIMTIVFTVMFYHFPSGLNIYWLSSLLLAMLQQWWMTKRSK